MKSFSKICITLLLCLGICFNAHAKEISNILPDEIKSITFEMTYLEFHNLFPNSRDVFSDSSGILTYLAFDKNKQWNSAMFSFEGTTNETLVLFGVDRLVIDGKNAADTSEIKAFISALKKNLTNEFGSNFQQCYVREDSRYLDTLYIWKLDEMTVLLNYTPDEYEEISRSYGVTLRFLKKGLNPENHMNIVYDKILNKNNRK